MRLKRPYIPLAVRVQVAERQMREILLWRKIPEGLEHGPPSARQILRNGLSDGAWLKFLLGRLFSYPHREVELHHRPALCNRYRDMKTGEYLPPANDPDYLVYLPKSDHDVETRVRGVGAQRSDLGQRRYLKKVAKNRAKDKKRPSRWPKRKYCGRSP